MIADLRPYPEYKESEVPWLGPLPRHWDTRVLKRLCSRSALYGANIPASDYVAAGVRFLRTTDITDDGVLRHGGVFVAPNVAKDHMLTEGDLLVSRSGTLGRSLRYRSKIHGPCAHAGYLVRFVPAPIVDPDYLFYFTKSVAFADFIRVSAVSSTIENVNGDKYANMSLTLPPPDEQAGIVRFLDSANGRLERAIRAKRKVIALLTEQKQAIIHRAVTRGLDPSVSLKPSGIPWFGDIPQHWEVHQLRRLVRPGRRITYGIVQPGEPDPNGRFMVRGQDYSFGWASPRSVFRVSRPVEEPYSRSRLMAGDHVLTIVGAGVGNVAVVPEWLDGANITQTTARISVDPSKANAGYVALVLQGPLGKRNVERYVKGAAQPGLNLEHVRIFLLPMPTPEEQAEIYSAIQWQLSRFNVAILRLEREIELLREYRARLVADVVTGKLDVREVAAQLPEETAPDTAEDTADGLDETESADEESAP